MEATGVAGAGGSAGAGAAKPASGAAKTAGAPGFGAPAAVPRCAKLHYVPQASIVGSYGGGDAMMTANCIMLLELDVPEARLAAAAPELQARVVRGIAETLADADTIPAADRVARVPGPDAAPSSEAAVSWNVRVQVSSRVHGSRLYNIMSQGWLFHEAVDEPGRLGVSKWPLVGIYDARGILAAEPGRRDDEGGLSRSVGAASLHPADQHVHLVDVDDSWHFGSDMAQFRTQPLPVVSGWVVVAVPREEVGSASGGAGGAGAGGKTSWDVEVQYLMIVAPDLEDGVERLLRKSAEGCDAAKLVAGWAELVTPLDGGTSEAVLRRLLGETAPATAAAAAASK